MKAFFLALVVGLVAAQCNFNTCTDCVSPATAGACGWCALTSRCVLGDSTGPTTRTDCPGVANNWIYGGESVVLQQTSGFPVNPIHFDVYLYPGSDLDLLVTVTNPLTDSVPLDLYIIEDLSASMEDDVRTFERLSRALTVDVLRYQSEPRFGLASFIEKPIAPFGFDDYTDPDNSSITWTWGGQTAGLDTNALLPCPTRLPESGPFNWAFCHEQDLSATYSLLPETLATFVNHVNRDWPENQMEALMFAAVCDGLNWRDDARRVVLLATDASAQLPCDLANASCPFTEDASPDCRQDVGTNGVPGTRDNYPEDTLVAGLLRTAGIVPVIASAQAPPNHDDLNEYWIPTVNGWGFGQVLELEPDSSNLIELIRAALAELATVMRMQLASDPSSQVLSFTPFSGYSNVGAGARRFFNIVLLDDVGDVEEETILFTIPGFGEVTINVTNQLPCRGCDGSANPAIIVDACGECNGGNVCLGCDSIPYSGAVVDRCGVCDGDGTSCQDCFGVANGTAVYDICNVCGGDGTTCVDCFGIIHLCNGSTTLCGPRDPNFATIDVCGECGGDGLGCLGCDDVINSSARLDECNVCNGNNQSCIVVLPSPPGVVAPVVAGTVAGVVFVVILVVAIVAIIVALGKAKFDKMQYMQNQQMTAVGSSPIYEQTGGWQDNLVSAN